MMVGTDEAMHVRIHLCLFILIHYFLVFYAVADCTCSDLLNFWVYMSAVFLLMPSSPE